MPAGTRTRVPAAGDGPGRGWHLIERRPDGRTVVIGPCPTCRARSLSSRSTTCSTCAGLGYLSAVDLTDLDANHG